MLNVIGTVDQTATVPIWDRMGIANSNFDYGLMCMFVNFDVSTDPNIDQVLTQLRYASVPPPTTLTR